MALKPLVTKPEATLVGLDDGRKLAKFRAIDDSGASITATPEQIAAALADPLAPLLAPKLGTDYSLLTEQIVPGEYFLDKNGAKKAVYTRTFRFVSPITLIVAENRGYWASAFTIDGISGILSTTGTVMYGDIVMAIIPFKEFMFYTEIVNNTLSIGGRIAKEYVGQNITVNVAVKYTKA